MKFINKQFAEFKSVFVSENILKENEEHANVVTASTMISVFWFCLITWILTILSILKLESFLVSYVFICSILLLVIPSIVCFMNQGKGKWIKHLLFISFTFFVAIADACLKYNVTLTMVIYQLNIFTVRKGNTYANA